MIPLALTFGQANWVISMISLAPTFGQVVWTAIRSSPMEMIFKYALYHIEFDTMLNWKPERKLTRNLSNLNFYTPVIVHQYAIYNTWTITTLTAYHLLRKLSILFQVTKLVIILLQSVQIREEIAKVPKKNGLGLKLKRTTTLNLKIRQTLNNNKTELNLWKFQHWQYNDTKIQWLPQR